MVDRAGEPDYKPALPSRLAAGSAQVAQLVEHATENRSVGGSIPPLGTMTFPSVCFCRQIAKSTAYRYRPGTEGRYNASRNESSLEAPEQRRFLAPESRPGGATRARR